MATRKKKPQPKRDTSIPTSGRSDGWKNVLTGINTSTRDKRSANEFEIDSKTLRRDLQESLWRGDDMFARIVETEPGAMMRAGWELKIKEDAADTATTNPGDHTAGLGGLVEGDDPGDPTAADPSAPPHPDEPAKDAPPDGAPAGAEPPKPGEETDPKAKPDEGLTSNDPAPASGDPVKADPAGAGSPEDPFKKKKAKTDAFPPKGGAPGGKPPFGGGAKPFGGGPPGAAPPPEKPPGVVELDDKGEATARAVQARYEELRGPEMFRKALQYRRAYGGACIILGADDGASDWTQPLDLENLTSFTWLNVLTPREMQAIRYYGDPRAPKYGEVEVWRVSAQMPTGIDGGDVVPSKGDEKGKKVKTKPTKVPVRMDAPPPFDPKAPPSAPDKKTSPSSLFFDIHESRVIAFPGVVVSDQHRVRAQGHGDSVLTRCMQVVSDFNMAYSGGAHLLSDFAQAVFKIKGLSALIEQNDDETVIKRAQLIDMCRSLARAILVDTEEDFERKQTPLTGYPEMLEKFGERVAACARMPVTMLMSQAPAGLNATGDSDIRNWYDNVSAEQGEYLQPRLEQFVRVLMRSKDGPTKGEEPEDWSIEFCPLWQPTAKEKADTYFVEAQGDEKYVAMGACTPEEVTASRFAGAESPIVVDIEARQKMATEFEAKSAEHEAQQKTLQKADPTGEKRAKAAAMAGGGHPAPPFGKGPPPAPGAKPAPFPPGA